MIINCFLLSLASTVSGGGNTFVPAPTIPDEPFIPSLPSFELPSIPSIALPSSPSLPAVELPSVPLGPSFDDTEFDPSDHSHAPKCVYLFADLLKSNIDKTFQETSR